MTAHVATNDGEFTTIGSSNVFLAYSHIAHDCQVGDHIVMSSHAALGGHVEVHDFANIGWGSGVHQFCQVGRYDAVSLLKARPRCPSLHVSRWCSRRGSFHQQNCNGKSRLFFDQIEMVKGYSKLYTKRTLINLKLSIKLRKTQKTKIVNY